MELDLEQKQIRPDPDGTGNPRHGAIAIDLRGLSMNSLKRELPVLLGILASAALIIWALNGSVSDRLDCDPYHEICHE